MFMEKQLRLMKQAELSQGEVWKKRKYGTACTNHHDVRKDYAFSSKKSLRQPQHYQIISYRTRVQYGTQQGLARPGMERLTRRKENQGTKERGRKGEERKKHV